MKDVGPQTYPLWPHRLVFNFPYGRWCTFFVVFFLLYLLLSVAGDSEVSRENASTVFFAFVIAYIIPASHYINVQTLAAFDSLRPVLKLDNHEVLVLRKTLEGISATSQIRIALVGCLAGFGHTYLLLGSQTITFKDLWYLDFNSLVNIMLTIIIWSLLSTVVTFLIYNVRVFASLAREYVVIDLLNHSGLRGFSRVAVYSTFLLLGVLASFPLLIVDSESNYLSILPGFLALFLPIFFIFLVPLLPIRKRIRTEKGRELALIQKRINEITSDNSSLVDNNESLSLIQALFEYRREIQQVPEWPFDSPAVYRLLFYLFIPPLTWVGAALIERLMDTISF